MEENKYELTCRILEIVYIQSRNNNNSCKLEDNYNLFPYDWFDNEAYEAKIKILEEAIDNNLLITETDSYVRAFSDIVFR